MNEGTQYLCDYIPTYLRRLRLPPCAVAVPKIGRPRPRGPEGEQQVRFARGEADRDNYRRSAVPRGANKKAEAVWSATAVNLKTVV